MQSQANSPEAMLALEEAVAKRERSEVAQMEAGQLTDTYRRTYGRRSLFSNPGYSNPSMGNPAAPAAPAYQPPSGLRGLTGSERQAVGMAFGLQSIFGGTVRKGMKPVYGTNPFTGKVN